MRESGRAASGVAVASSHQPAASVGAGVAAGTGVGVALATGDAAGDGAGAYSFVY